MVLKILLALLSFSNVQAELTSCSSNKNGKIIKFFADYDVVEGIAFGEYIFERDGQPRLIDDFNSDELAISPSGSPRMNIGKGFFADLIIVDDALTIKVFEGKKAILTCQ